MPRSIVSCCLALSLILVLSACDSSGDSESPFVMETLRIESRDTFKGELGAGYAHVCPGSESAAEPRNLLIKVNGFSRSVDRVPPPDELLSTCDNQPADRNYHFIETRWSNGADYIQRNAGFIRGVIEELSTKYNLNDSDNIAIVGYSMGGLVARYTLQSIESEGLNHNIDLYVSVDSPHAGAFVPIGLQHIVKAFEDFGGADELAELETPAARQMLRYHNTQGNLVQTWTDDYQVLHIDELQGALGGFPRAPGLRTVAVASGRTDGVQEEPLAGNAYLKGHFARRFSETISRVIDDNPFDVAGVCTFTFTHTFNVDVRILAEAIALQLLPGESTVAETDFEAFVDGIDINNREGLVKFYQDRFIQQRPSGCAGFYPASGTVIDRVVGRAVAEGQRRAAPYTDKFKDKVYKAYADGLVSSGVPGGRGSNVQTLRNVFAANGFNSSSDVVGDGSHMFTDTGSAMAIPDLAHDANVAQDDFTLRSPFDKVYAEPNNNLGHIRSSAPWFVDEVLGLFEGE